MGEETETGERAMCMGHGSCPSHPGSLAGSHSLGYI